MQVERKIRSRVKRQMEKTQREYYLNEQLKAIQKELGEGEEGRDELAELEERIKKTKLSQRGAGEGAGGAEKAALDESRCPPKPRSCVIISTGCCRCPGARNPRSRRISALAESVLNADHYGLEKVKERILEYLAVQSARRQDEGADPVSGGSSGRRQDLARQVDCARTGREFVRMSLGGVRDEAEIRGHRRTYIGSMPGKIIQSMKKAKSANPLFLLDEVDKLGADWRGDPSAALLEVLDPEQNHSFNDHYLEVDFDLSDVMFITTANTLRMPQPLMDRMEIIRIPGYTEDEKVEIAKRHLLPKQLEAHGLKDNEWSITDDAHARSDPLLHAGSWRS